MSELFIRYLEQRRMNGTWAKCAAIETAREPNVWREAFKAKADLSWFDKITPEQLAAMYGYPGPSDADGWDVPAPPCDVEAVYPAPVEAKAAEPVPQDEAERLWEALREIAQG